MAVSSDRLYRYMVEQARLRDRRYFCADQTAATALHVNRRTIIRWRCQLEAAGRIERYGYHQWGPRCKTVVYGFPKGQTRLNVTQRTTCRRTSSRTSFLTQDCFLNLGSRARKSTNERNPMTERERDLAWEALVRETAANPAMERGKINAALKGIREAAFTEGLTEEGLPEEIRLRAEAYRRTFPGLAMTPTALAVHWFRVMVQPVAPQSREMQAIDQLRRRS